MAIFGVRFRIVTCVVFKLVFELNIRKREKAVNIYIIPYVHVKIQSERYEECIFM